MRTWIKTLLIISAALIATGLVFFGVSVAFGGADVTFNKNVKYTEVTSTFDEINYISASAEFNDVVVRQGDNDFIKVIHTQSEDTYYDISISATGSLRIIFHDNRQWHGLISFGSNRGNRLVIELPEKSFEYINISTSSGDIKATDLNALETFIRSTSGNVELGGTVGELTAKTTSGDIQLNSNTAALNASVSSTSGDIRLSGDMGGNLNADTTSGEINFSGCFATDAVINTTSGDVDAKALYLKNAQINTTSGSVELDDSTCAETCKIETISGDIDLERYDAKDYDLKTVSGEIDADIISPKLYNIDTVSGTINAPKNETVEGVSGTFDAETTSGSVTVKIVAQ